MNGTRRLSRTLLIVGFAAAFGTILGAKWWLIDGFGSDLPYWDQWYAEGYRFFVPWMAKSLSWRDLFASGNEHRMFFSRVLSLVLLMLNGQWDARLQNMVNAVVHAVVVVGIGVMLWRACGKRFARPILGLIVATTALPFAYENTLWGFQSCFYFLIGFAALTIGLLGEARPWSPRWLAGCLVSVAGLFTMGSGFLAPAAILVALGLRSWRHRSVKGAWSSAAVCLATMVAGLVLLKGTSGDRSLGAATVVDFAGAFSRSLAWPWVTVPWLALLAWLPAGILLVRLIRSRRDRDEGLPDLTPVLALGAWVILQAAAMAWSRGAGGQRPASRYMDILGLGVVVNGLALCLLAQGTAGSGYRRLGRLVAFVWLPWLVAGLGLASGYVLRRSLPTYRADHVMQLDNVRGFVQTDSMSFLAGKALRAIPNSSPDALALYLRNSAIRSILPVSVREPLRVSRAGEDRAFAAGGVGPATPSVPSERTWGSYLADGARSRGTFESRPLRDGTLPFLQFEVAGSPAGEGVTLAVRGASGPLRPVRWTGLAERWSTATVARPVGAVTVVAQDDSERSWLAFREPREMGRWSYLAAVIAARAIWLLVAGLGVLLYTLAAPELVRRWAPSGHDTTELHGERHA